MADLGWGLHELLDERAREKRDGCGGATWIALEPHLDVPAIAKAIARAACQGGVATLAWPLSAREDPEDRD